METTDHATNATNPISGSKHGIPRSLAPESSKCTHSPDPKRPDQFVVDENGQQLTLHPIPRHQAPTSDANYYRPCTLRACFKKRPPDRLVLGLKPYSGAGTQHMPTSPASHYPVIIAYSPEDHVSSSKPQAYLDIAIKHTPITTRSHHPPITVHSPEDFVSSTGSQAYAGAGTNHPPSATSSHHSSITVFLPQDYVSRYRGTLPNVPAPNAYNTESRMFRDPNTLLNVPAPNAP